jgi:hypothetical protein
VGRPSLASTCSASASFNDNFRDTSLLHQFSADRVEPGDPDRVCSQAVDLRSLDVKCAADKPDIAYRLDNADRRHYACQDGRTSSITIDI